MRRRIAAGLALALATGGCALGARPAAVISAAVFAASDRDHDGMLDRQEIAAMVDAAFPPERRQGSGWDALRAGLIAGYAAQDRDGDGRLSRDELARAFSSEGGR